jgi:hypothetical protein
VRATDYSLVLRLACDLYGVDYTNLDTSLGVRLRGLIDRRLALAWESEYWPELQRTEARKLRREWNSATTYAPGDEVYYTSAVGYYQALRSNSNQTPADSSGVENSAYWAECGASYSGTDYSSTTAYTAGQQVYYPTTGQYYQCHTASTNNVPTNASYWGLLRVFNRYVALAQTEAALSVSTLTRSGTTATCTTSINHKLSTGVRVTVAGADQTAYNGRFTVTVTSGTVFTFTVANSPATPATGTVTATPYLEPIGEVLRVTSADGRVTRNFKEYSFTLTNDGVTLPASTPVVWVEYRVRRPVLTGGDYSSTSAYAVDDQVLFTSGSVRNFYTCVSATSAGESPSTHADKWVKAEIPYIFQNYLVYGAVCDQLRADGEWDRARLAEAMAEAAIAQEANKLYNYQVQGGRVAVGVY